MSSCDRPGLLRRLVPILAAWVLVSCGSERPDAGASDAGDETTTLTVFNAAALGPPLRDALRAFGGTPPRTDFAQENAPSLEVVRKLTELGQVPDLLAVADEALLRQFVVPAYATWYVRFGTNAMVLAHGPRARHADEITTANWWQILQRPGVQVGRSDLRVDPSGYRADMVMQLAEAFHGEPGLTARLRATIPERNIRRAEADLSAHLASGELDYGWTYENLAVAHGLRYVRLPPEIDLSVPAFASRYAEARVEIPQAGTATPLVLTGAPIVFALTIPARAANPRLALRFVQYLLSPAGREALRRSGFSPLETPEFEGAAPATLRAGGRAG
jgi:molybdate/tungstate transport system substrate-binding protein